MLRLKHGDVATRLLILAGVCGEIPISILRQWGGYYDYLRRLVTRLVREEYLRERKLQGYHRHVVRSLSITSKGLERLMEVTPGPARVISRNIVSPADGQGDLKRTLRLHRGAWCILTALRLGAVLGPSRKEKAMEERRLVFFTTYELNHMYGWDSKGCRASGVFLTPQLRFVPTYYLGSQNMYWTEDVENGFRDRLEMALRGCGYYPGSDLFLSEDWSLAENLVRHWVRPRTRMIRPGRPFMSYCLPVNENGIALMEMVLDECVRIDFQNYIKEYGFNLYGPDMQFMFELERLAEFVSKPGKGTFFSPPEGYFFDFQMETVKRINDGNSKLITLPQTLLQNFMDIEGIRRYL